MKSMARYSSRATVRPQTDLAPAAWRATAQASSVAPIVQTSSDVWTRHTKSLPFSLDVAGVR